MNSTIARGVIFARRPGEERFQIAIEIGTPYQCGPEEWACPVSLEPLYAKADLHGIDSFQALCLAIRFGHNLLTGFLEDGGTLTFEDGEPFPLDSSSSTPKP